VAIGVATKDFLVIVPKRTDQQSESLDSSSNEDRTEEIDHRTIRFIISISLFFFFFSIFIFSIDFRTDTRRRRWWWKEFQGISGTTIVTIKRRIEWTGITEIDGKKNIETNDDV